jgi:plastocyanin
MTGSQHLYIEKDTPPPDPATLGDITGTVHLSGKPPAPVKIDTSMDPACAMSGAPDFNAEQYVVQDGKLANVYLYIKSGPPAAMSAPGTSTAPVVLDQKGCRYTPHVIAVMRGGSVSFQNSDVTMHNIHTMPTVVGNEAIDISQGPRGVPVVRQFKDAEAMMPVRCNNHPWMNAFINVSATPFFAVTDASGHFDLKGLPAGDYVLGAVHEKLGEQTLKLTVPAKGAAKADFTFTMR